MKKSFSSNPFMVGYDGDIFSYDKELGYKFPFGKLIGHNRFVSFDAAIFKTSSEETVILNLGDSSTSGWNGDRIYKGSSDLSAPFFTYRTYSDVLAERGECGVLNAGVPGYTSLQGKKYFNKILRRLWKKGIKCDAATFYFGNNDSTYNEYEDKVKLDGNDPTPGESNRVSIDDYEANMREMIEMANESDIKPILIMPLINYAWAPGLRSVVFPHEAIEAMRQLKNGRVRDDLLKAYELHQDGKYQEACEHDRVLPRIKTRYRDTLRRIAEETSAPLIDIQEHVSPAYEILSLSARTHFLDYCHPLEPTNKIIANEIIRITGIEGNEMRPLSDPEEPLKNKVIETLSKALRNLVRQRKKDTKDPPNVYPFY